MKRIVKVGSRESALAVKQAEIVMNSIKKHEPDIEFEPVTIKTKGDEILDKALGKIGGKGLFVKELEQALMDFRIDIAVHSYKDMPCDETCGLPIVALSERESPFDALVLPEGIDIGSWTPDKESPVGSSSLRRSIQLKMLFNGCKTAPIRGNVATRLAKLDSGGYCAVVLADAGLSRLGLRHRISRVFTPEEMLPSASQGILAVQGRAGESYSYLSGFHSRKSEYVSKAERQFLKALEAGCGAPVAAYCEVHGNELKLMGMYAVESGQIEKSSVCGMAEQAEKLGEKLAVLLKKAVEKW